MKSLCDWMMPKKREKSLGVHGSSVSTVKRFPKQLEIFAYLLQAFTTPVEIFSHLLKEFNYQTV